MKLIKLLFAGLVDNRFYKYWRYANDLYMSRVSSMVSPGSILLDAGAGECQYKKYFLNVKYIAQDLCIGASSWDYSCIDIISEIYDIPLEKQSVDNILCIEVIEHLRYPQRAFAEFSRILKPNGRLFLITPFIWEEHQQPHDYFRYTQFALKMLAQEQGFEVEEIIPQGGRFICLAELIINSIPLFLRERNHLLLAYAYQAVFYPFNFMVGFLCYFLDHLDNQKRLTLQYECIFIKK